MPKEKLQQFKNDLKKLLTRYNADISFDCSECSDLHGVNDEKIVANVNGKNITLAVGYSVDQTDL
jgi:hypothetical protein